MSIEVHDPYTQIVSTNLRTEQLKDDLWAPFLEFIYSLGQSYEAT